MIDLQHLFSRRTAKPTGTFGYAVVGLGRIAEHFLRGLEGSSIVRATALVSGDPKKAGKLAKEFHVPHTLGYADFDTVRERDDVQAVYLALPVSMHLEFTERAARAGKHVFVEKPMASDAAECRAMIEACRTAGVLLSVAYRCPFDAMHRRLRTLIAERALGEVERISSAFGFKLATDDWRYNNALAGGGSAYDVGVYPLNAARFLLGTEPEITSAAATVNGAGLETSIAWSMRFPDGVEADCRSSYLEYLPGTLTVRGSMGELTLDPAFTHKYPVELKGWYTDPRSGKRVEVKDSAREMPSHFRLEAEHLAACALRGEPVITSGEDGLRDMELIADMYRKAGVATA